MKNVDELKMVILNEKNNFSREEWELFVLWLIEEIEFRVDTHFNIEPDCYDCEKYCSFKLAYSGSEADGLAGTNNLLISAPNSMEFSVSSLVK